MDGGDATHATTPVVFLRNLPPNTSEKDVADACSAYGTVARLYMVPLKQMAFVQFDSVESADRAVQSTASQPIFIHDREVQATASTKTEVTGQYSEGPFSDVPVIPRGAPRTGRGTRRDDYDRGDRDGLPPLHERTVILVQLFNLTESVSMDEFYTVFAYFGDVVRMSYFIKDQQNRLLVEYKNHDSAARAHAVLRHCNIGICEFAVEWSRLPALTFTQIDKKNRDYAALAPVKPTERATRARDAVARADHEYVPYDDEDPSYDPREDAHGVTIRRDYDRDPRRAGYDDRRRMGAVAGPRGMGGPPGMRGRRVLFVSGVPSEVGAPQLLRLFVQYGDVRLVRVLYSKPDQALVEMEYPEGAQCARERLDEVPIMGSHLRVTLSKHDSLKIPPPGSDDAELCAGPLQRASSAMRIVPPNHTLHVSNIVAEVGEDESSRRLLRERLQQFGRIEAEEWIPPPAGNTRWMGRFRMESVEVAVACVAFLNHTNLLDRSTAAHQPFLKVAFAVRQVSQQAEAPPTDAHGEEEEEQ